MVEELSVDPARLLRRLQTLGEVGRDSKGQLARVALSREDKDGRDLLVRWMRDLGLRTDVDAVGNIFGTWVDGPRMVGSRPVMAGSHIDTVVDAGIYDGSLGVVAALEAVESMKEAGVEPLRPVTVAAFTNEEGVRYAPDMMGSLVHAGALPVEAALEVVGTDGTVLGEELERIGYSGSMAPGSIQPRAFVELHVEQGPVLDREDVQVGVVEAVQGISWQRVSLRGEANHAGTTPLDMRRDAGYAAARLMVTVRGLVNGSTSVATVGTVTFEPNLVNVIPARATLTLDLRDGDGDRLRQVELQVDDFLETLVGEGIGVDTEGLARVDPVSFDTSLTQLIEDVAEKRGFTHRRMTSGAGHDAQILQRVTPSAMIFVPSAGGYSHSPDEMTRDEDVVAGANVLLDTLSRMATDPVVEGVWPDGKEDM